MIFPRKYAVPKICCPRSIQATHGILMPVTVKFRIDFLVRGLQGDLLWHLSTSAPCFQLPLFAKCDALPKRGLFDMFV